MEAIREEFSVDEASRALRVSQRRIRAMVRDGVLGGRRLGGRWLIRGADVEQRARQQSRPGRPMSERNAWAVLWRLSSGEWPALPAWDRSRLQQKLKRRSLLSLASDLRARAKLRLFRADSRVLERIRSDPAFMRSGVSAAADYGVDLRAPGVVEGYLERDRLDDLVYRYALQSANGADANLVLHLIRHRLPDAQGKVAPVAAVALDLLESDDPRAQRAGRDLARRQR